MESRIGQLGNGRFGKKIIGKLNTIKDTKLVWVSTSQDKWWENTLDVDWVIVATPNEFHYEQSKFFLEKGINVFCEKPASFSYKETKLLYKLAIDNNCKFYVDDVLSYEKIKPTKNFIYKKWGTDFSNIIDRIAYHHFYLIQDQVDGKELTIKVSKNKKLFKKFSIECNGKFFNFEYNFNWYKKKTHNIEPTADKDALLSMLEAVIKGTANYKENEARTLFATKLSQQVKEKLYGKIAVIGAGIYGITAAIKLSAKGYSVDLFEKKSDIISATSGINQYRVHRGYHYPRSKDTILSCRNNEKDFIKYYSRSIIDNVEHFYAIAKEDSLTSPREYLHMLDECKLKWKIVDTLPECELTVQVEESLYCPDTLRKICWDRIKACNISTFLNTTIKDKELLEGYEFKVFSTYSSLNDFDKEKKEYQYELCEKPIFKLPIRYKGKSIVIMDGPFMCFDPYSNTPYHVAGNVVHAIHNRIVGKESKIPPAYRKYLNKGIINNPKFTNAESFKESAKKFFPDIDQAEHIGSMYTIRTVLPNRDDTDERPTIVRFNKDEAILFSGKVVNCVEAAEKIAIKL